MDIRKILVATDFSAEAERALAHSMELARHLGAEIVLLNVCAMVEPSEYRQSGNWQDLLRQHMAASRQRLEQVRASVSGQGVEVSHMIIDADPPDGIVKSADQLGADLIVLGSHGLSGVQRLLLGSVAERVVRTSRTSVLVVRGDHRPAGGYRNILVPSDFSVYADRALEVATRLVAAGGSISLRHYWHEPVFGPVLDVGALAEKMDESISHLGADRLHKYQSDRYSIEFAAGGGLARHAILDELDEGSYDVVVVGSHGRRGVKRWLLGSTAESTARHARCSVLVVKSARA